MSATQSLTRMTTVESRLFLRDRGAAFFALGFPALLLTAMGMVMPWSDEPFESTDPLYSGVNGITAYAPTVLAIAVATVALSTFPTVIATYRQRGVLRRLSTTPVPRTQVLVSQLLVNLGALLVAAVLMLAFGMTLGSVQAPRQPLVLLLVFLVSVPAVFAIGALVAAVAPTTGSATGMGMTIYFVSLFFAGTWIPLALMPEALRDVAQYTPLGAAAQAMSAAWLGGPFPTTEVLVMAGWAAVGVPLAAKLFRWQ